jgi:hypothetical protein
MVSRLLIGSLDELMLFSTRFLNWRILLHRPSISHSAFKEGGVMPFTSIKTAAAAQVAALRAEICVEASIKLIEHMTAFYTHGLNSAWWYDLNCKYQSQPNSHNPSAEEATYHANHLHADIFSAATVLLARNALQPTQERILHTIDLAVDLMKGMQDGGKILAGEYLSLLEKLRQHVVNKVMQERSLTFLPTGSSGPEGYPISPRTGGENGGNGTGGNGVNGNGNGGNEYGDTMAYPPDIDVSLLLDDLAFPWNITSAGLAFEEEFPNYSM